MMSYQIYAQIQIINLKTLKKEAKIALKYDIQEKYYFLIPNAY